MPDESDPPRKFYGLKPREFERVNHASPAASAPAAPAAASGEIAADPGPRAVDDQPIDTRELARIGSANVPTLGVNLAPNRDNEVHVMMRENVARENALGLNQLKPKKRRPSKRRRDYWLVLIAGNSAIAAIAGFDYRYIVTVFFGLGGMLFFTAGLTWIMWFVMDDY